VSFDAAVVHPIEAFPAPALIASAATSPLPAPSQRQGAIPPRVLEDVGDLAEFGVPEWAQILIANGATNPDVNDFVAFLRDDWIKPDFLAECSRSEAQHSVIRCLVEMDVPEDLVRGIFLDARPRNRIARFAADLPPPPIGRWGIADHALESKNPERAVDRSYTKALAKIAQQDEDQLYIRRAGDNLDEMVDRINESFFAVNENGTHREYMVDKGTSAVRRMSGEAMTHALGKWNVSIGEGKAATPLKLWRSSSRQHHYLNGWALDPSQGVSTREGARNLWAGFGVEPALGCWDLIREHCRDVLCGGHPTQFEYLLNWLAWKLQNPARVPETAIVLRGEEGAGKGVIANMLVRLFGRHGARFSTISQVVGDFNGQLRQLAFVYIDEARVTDAKARSAFWGMVTDPTYLLNAKNVEAYQFSNYLGFWFATNDEHFLSVTSRDRRFFVPDVSNARVGDGEYFARLAEEVRGAGPGAMLYDLLRRDLGAWHPRRGLPESQAKIAQVRMSLPPVERVVLGWLESGELPMTLRSVFGDGSTFEDIRAQICEALPPHERGLVNHRTVRPVLDAIGAVRRENARPRVDVFPPLKACREAWNRAMPAARVEQWFEPDAEWSGS